MVKRERIYKKKIFNTLVSRSRPERVNEKSETSQVLLWFEQINPLSPDGVHTYDRLVVLNNQNMNLTLTLKIQHESSMIFNEKYCH